MTPYWYGHITGKPALVIEPQIVSRVCHNCGAPVQTVARNLKWCDVCRPKVIAQSAKMRLRVRRQAK